MILSNQHQKIGIAFFSLLFLFIPVQASAHITQKHQISIIKVQDNGAYVSLAGFSGAMPMLSCGRDAFWLPLSNPNFENILSLLITAKVENLPIRVTYYTCFSNLIEMGSVQI